MPGMRLKGFTGLMIAGSMLASSTGAAAAASVGPQQISPWATLTVLSGGAPAAALCGAAAATAAAAQPATGCVLPTMDAPPPVASAAPPPPPPLEPVAAGYGISPLLLGLVAIAGAVAIYFAVHGNNHHNVPVPNSPG